MAAIEERLGGDGGLAVVFAQQLHTLLEILHADFPIAIPCQFRPDRRFIGAALIIPVNQGVVEEGENALAVAGIHKLPDQVAPAAVGCIVVVQTAGVVQRAAS